MNLPIGQLGLYMRFRVRVYSHSELLWSSVSLREVLVHWFSRKAERWKNSLEVCKEQEL